MTETSGSSPQEECGRLDVSYRRGGLGHANPLKIRGDRIWDNEYPSKYSHTLPTPSTSGKNGKQSLRSWLT
jgi:hypothetical protein